MSDTILQEPPRDTQEASIDEKGRLRIPAPYVRYIESLGDTSVFVTGVDRETARVYPMSVWRKNEAKMKDFQGDREAQAHMAQFAKLSQYLGRMSEIDNNGRVWLSQALRDLLGFQLKSIAHLSYFDDAFDLETDAVVKRKRQEYMDALVGGMPLLRSLGIK